MVQSIVCPSPEEVKKYSGKNIEEMKETPAPKPEQILADGVLIKGSRACIYANPKVGKSVISTQLGLCCASGVPFLDIPVIYSCNVFYLNFEVDDHMMETRVLEIQKKLGLDIVPKFRKHTLLGEDVPLLDTNKGLENVARILQVQEYLGFPVELLIWDCRYKTVRRSENQDDVMKEWCRHMEELTRIFDFTLMVVHHKGKDTKGAGAGSSVFDRWINTSIEVKPHHWGSALSPSAERKVIIGGNYTEGYEKYAVLDFPIHRLGGQEAWQKPLSKKEEAKDVIIEILQNAPENKMEQTELWTQAKKRGVTQSTFNDAKRELEMNDTVKSEQDPTKAGHHNIIKLTPLLAE